MCLWENVCVNACVSVNLFNTGVCLQIYVCACTFWDRAWGAHRGQLCGMRDTRGSSSLVQQTLKIRLWQNWGKSSHNSIASKCGPSIDIPLPPLRLVRGEAARLVHETRWTWCILSIKTLTPDCKCCISWCTASSRSCTSCSCVIVHVFRKVASAMRLLRKWCSTLELILGNPTPISDLQRCQLRTY
jgi:hypothetical protein